MPVKSKRGRPSKLDQETVRTITGLLRAGAMIDSACSSAGITRETFYVWMKKGAKEDAGQYSDFADKVKKALANAENSMVAEIRAAGKTQWTALAWLLERRFRARWGRDLTGSEVKSTTNSKPPAVKPKTSD